MADPQAIAPHPVGQPITTPLRIATWNVELERRGPGLLLRDILSGKDSQVLAALQVLTALDADILLLTGFDYDHDLITAGTFADQLALIGARYPHRFAQRPNRGMQTGLDLDGDGRSGGPDDAQGFGWFSGQAGMLLLSRLPILTDQVQDLSALLWADLPGAIWPAATPAEVLALQRLPTSGHWIVPVALPDGGSLQLLCWHATPPVFDGPEDRNGRRNHDEAALWLALLTGRLARAAPAPPLVLLGTSNLDPLDGEGRPAALEGLLALPTLQDPRPRADQAAPDLGHRGDARLDTAVFPDIGGLRLETILPSADVTILNAGVMRHAADPGLDAALAKASRHFPVWVDLSLTIAKPPRLARGLVDQ